MDSSRRKLKITRIRDNTVLIFPITPFPKFTWGVNKQKQDLLGVGEMDVGATPKLTTVNIPNVILPHPDNNYDFVFIQKMPSYYLNYLKEFVKYQNNLLLEYYADTESEKIFSLNCRLSDIEDVGEENGNKNIVIGKLKFEEYKDNRVYEREYLTDSQRAINDYGSNIYYVKDGDNLINIAKKVYGDSSKWQILMSKNGLNNPLDISIGMGLYI